MLTKLRWAVSLAILLFGGLLIIWASIPLKHTIEVLVLQPTMMKTDESGQGDGAAVRENRTVRLEWQELMRIGEEGKIHLAFEKASKNPASTDVEALEDAYHRYNIMAEAKFEAAGIRVEPANPTRESMPAGQTIRFMWDIDTNKPGWYDGRIWLSLRFLPLDGSLPVQIPVFVKDIKIHSISILGLSGPIARILGWIGLAMGVGLVIIQRMKTTKKLQNRM